MNSQSYDLVCLILAVPLACIALLLTLQAVGWIGVTSLVVLLGVLLTNE